VPWRTILGWSGLLIGAAAIVAVGVFVVFWPVSDLIAAHDVGAITGPHRGAALQVARDAARGRLLTFGAGLFAAGALIYTARNFTLTRRTVELTEQGQVTDRYTKAIEQLGSDKLHVRIGGIYALERIARDSARDHPAVMEVLTAFIREHSHEPRQPSADDEPVVDAPGRGAREDIQAAVTVIGRRKPEHDQHRRLVLYHANLTRADLAGLDFAAAYLVRVLLTGADLQDADLHSAILSFADLTGANLSGVNLSGARLYEADLTGADLTGANFLDANLGGALWPLNAVVPEGWQRDVNSGRLKWTDIDAGDAAAS
jgi:hypothetical protein